MIGTLICRNCDTVFEVSEGDVTKFKVHPVFSCTVCQADLSPLMAGFVEGHSAKADPANEFTIPEDSEVFDGLPMGETFDQAAAKIREATGPAPAFTAQARPSKSEFADTVRSAEPPLAARARTENSIANEPTPLMRQPDPTPIYAPPEDPLQMALRLAAQAAQQAAAMAGASPALGNGDAGSRPATPARTPVSGDPRSTEIGVVPEEPDNEPTARGRGASENSETTEPTMPSPEATVSHDEPTPLLGASQFRAADGEMLPDAADDEAIPDLADDIPAPRATARPQPTPTMRPVPPHQSDPPPDEVTIRKSTPPPPLAMVRPLLARSGNGPASVGALGIRVVGGRPIVRPASNGRAQPSLDTAISASNPIPRFEPARTPASGTRAPAPAPVSDTLAPAARAPAKPVPAMLLAVVGFLAFGLLVVVGWAIAHHRASTGTAATPEPTATAVVEATEEPAATLGDAIPATSAHHTPAATPNTVASPVRTLALALPTVTPVVARTAAPQPTPTLAVVSATPRATPTQVAAIQTPKLAASTPAPALSTQKAIEAGLASYNQGDYEGAFRTVRLARLTDANNEGLNFYFWKFALAAKKDPEALEGARTYLAKHPAGAHVVLVKPWLEKKDKEGAH